MIDFDPAEVARVAQTALGVSLEDRTVAILTRFLAELGRWNATHNLTAVRDPGQMLVQHLADCLAVVPPLREHLARQSMTRKQGTGGPVTRERLAVEPAMRLLDVGSGGGLPGAVVAIVAPEIDVTCIDAVAKKAAFVRHVAAVLVLPNLHAVHGRVEALQPERPFDVVSSRAFGTLRDLVTLSRHLVAPEGVWMAMKGRAPDEEVAALPADMDVFHVKPLQVPALAAQRCLVWMRLRP